MLEKPIRGGVYYCNGGRYTRDTVVVVTEPHLDDGQAYVMVADVMPSSKRGGTVRPGDKWEVNWEWLEPHSELSAADPNTMFKNKKKAAGWRSR